MDSDSIFYFIFMGGVVFFSFLNSMKKAKAEKEQREQAMRNQQRNQSTASPQNNTSTESKQFDEWFNQAEPDEPEPEPEPEQPITSLEDLIKALSQPKQKPQPHVAATPPQLPPQPAPQRSIAIEPPENEGPRATATLSRSSATLPLATTVRTGISKWMRTTSPFLMFFTGR